MMNRRTRQPRREPRETAPEPPAARGRAAAAVTPGPRGHEQVLRDLLRAGLDRQQAQAQIARLEAGDVWGG